jgi:hypothetical protein
MPRPPRPPSLNHSKWNISWLCSPGRFLQPPLLYPTSPSSMFWIISWYDPHLGNIHIHCNYIYLRLFLPIFLTSFSYTLLFFFMEYMLSRNIFTSSAYTNGWYVPFSFIPIRCSRKHLKTYDKANLKGTDFKTYPFLGLLLNIFPARILLQDSLTQFSQLK